MPGNDLTGNRLPGERGRGRAPTCAPPPKRIRRDALVRLITDVLAAALSLLAAVITARALGPSGKGVFATLTMLGGILNRLAAGGLGDAAIRFVGEGRSVARDAIGAGLGGVFALAALATPIYVLCAWLLVDEVNTDLAIAILAIGLAVPIQALANLLSRALVMRLQIGRACIVALAAIVASTIGLGFLVAYLDLGLAGAGLAVVVGALAGLGLASYWLRGLGFLRPRWRWSYLAQALPYGFRLEVSHLVTLLSAKADLLLVYVLAGAADAGYYSVALTVGTMAAMPPFAIVFAVFPRLPSLGHRDAQSMTAQAARSGLGVGAVAVAATIIVLPSGIPLLLGESFSPATIPALVTVVGSLGMSLAWIIGRAAAARGDASLLIRSFGGAFVLMILLDLVLIPTAGVLGAAIASTVSYGFAAYVAIRRIARDGVQVCELLPRPQDVNPVALMGRLVR